MRLAYRPAVAGEPLGPLFATFWLRGTAVVPEGWAGARADLLLDTGGEATLWLDGEPVQGLNSGPRMLRASAPLVDGATGGEHVPFALELACNDLFGFGEAGQGAAASFALRRCELARFDREAWAEWHDLDVLAALERDPGVDPAWAGLLLAELHAFTLDGDRGRLARLLAHPASGMHRMTAIGHAHLDTAWLWPLEETWRKLVRTTTSQLRLMDAYPEHRFAHSQAQHYAWLAEREPGLFARVRAAVARGQWIPVGAMWVEPDCNLPSGESLARQLLYGQRFFERELGRRCTELWLPDVFGYAAQLPQLMRLAGLDRFLTQKLSWNRFTAPESHTFIWQGLDGSEVLTHFPPADTYNAEATVPELRAAAATTRTTRAPAARCSSSATATAAAGRPRRCSSACGGPATSRGCRRSRSPRPRRSSTGSRRRRRTCGRSSASSTSSTTAARTRPRPRSSAATGAASGRCRTPSCSTRCWATAAASRSSTGCGASCCSTSSTTSSPARASPRSTRAPGPTSRRWRPGPRRSPPACSDRRAMSPSP